jgi:serine/threonine protein kinase/tetratricopeptide (TPR) repeat protein
MVMLEAGIRFGRFTILAPLGTGGMGEVYRARDERLDRDVALKVLPADVAGDRDRLDRFEREAKALARLSHSNILAIHEFGEDRGVTFVVTELLEGETLRERLRRGTPTWRQSLDVGAFVAEGLAAAHAKGIVHRDLKPENVFLTVDGRVKVLDFGLARIQEGPLAELDTVTSPPPGTQAGAVLGTVGYMAPEQVRGERADHRSDVFALGCVLHEMLGGTPPFRRRSAPETMSAILRDEPPELTSLGGDVPAELAGVLARCLAKRPEQRFQAAADLAFALRSMLTCAPSAPPARGVQRDEHPSIAVLPFANLSADPEQEYFCDGVAEEIINALAHVQGMRVVARTSAFAFKGRNADVREIGGALDVGAVLEGSVRKAGNRLRITAQLIDVASGYHLWSERFDRTLEDVFAIQDEIALAVVENLKVRLLGRERAALERRYTENLEAHNAYLRARYEWNRMVPEGFARSRELYEEALGLDEGLVPAYVGLAAWYISQAFWAHLEPREALARALPLVERALTLDPASAEAWYARGNIAGLAQYRFVEAEGMLRKAIELAPSLAEAHLYLGGVLYFRGRPDEAIPALRRAARLDPISPTTAAWGANWLGHAGAREEGVAELEKLIAMYPEHWLPYWSLAPLLALTDRAAGLAAAEKALTLSGRANAALTFVACLSYAIGDAHRADEVRRELEERRAHMYVPPSLLAWIELARGERAAAMALLEEARDGNDLVLPFTRLGFGAVYPSDTEVERFLERLMQ